MSEVRSAEALPIPGEKLAFFRSRLKNRLHSFVLGKWDEQRDKGVRAVSQVDLAGRLGKRPEQINRWLSAPGNWTLETLSDLLLAIAGEEIPLDGEPSFDAPPVLHNHNGPPWADGMRVAGDTTRLFHPNQNATADTPEADPSATHERMILLAEASSFFETQIIVSPKSCLALSL